MNNKLTTLIIIALSMLTFVLAQNDPPPLPGAPNQGPIGGMGWLAMSGLILAAVKYFGSHKK
jgi:hypothetical protein